MRKLLQHIPLNWLIVVGFVGAHLLFVLSKWHSVPMADGMPSGQVDPDTWLRLTLARDYIRSGEWYDHLIHYSNAGLAPIASPWTRPLDVVIQWLVSIQPSDIDLNLRLIRAGLLMPVIWMAFLLMGLLRLTRQLLPLPSAGVMVTLLLITQQPMWNYFSLGNADHHAPLAALFTWVLGFVLATKPSRASMVLTGLLLGLMMWISVEALMLIGAIYLFLGLCWLLCGDRQRLEQLSMLTISTALFTALALAAERPPLEWNIPLYDSISIVHVAVLTLCAQVAWLLRIVPGATLHQRWLWAILAGAILVAGILLTYPHLFDGPLYGVEPFIYTDFMPRINEARPFYKVGLLEILPFIIVPWASILLCLAPWIRPERAFYDRQRSRTLVFFLILTTALYYFEQRWSYYMLPLAMAVLAPVLGALFTPEHPLVSTRWPANMLIGLSPNQQMKKRLPVTLAFLATPMMLALASAAPDMMKNAILGAHEAASAIGAAMPSDNETTVRNACYDNIRRLARSGELRKFWPTHAVVLVPTDVSTEILFFTGYQIIASNYHREGKGIQYVWSTYDLTDEAALHERLKERNVSAVIACPSASKEPKSLLQRYAAPEATLPDWLRLKRYTMRKELQVAEPPPFYAMPALLKVVQ